MGQNTKFSYDLILSYVSYLPSTTKQIANEVCFYDKNGNKLKPTFGTVARKLNALYEDGKIIKRENENGLTVWYR